LAHIVNLSMIDTGEETILSTWSIV
jgi:hypothetical protein